MKEKNSFLIEQEKQANKLAAQVMQFTFLFFAPYPIGNCHNHGRQSDYDNCLWDREHRAYYSIILNYEV